ncbi:MAG: GSCFA domain-containing protein, partial [Luteolibacter sp.]
MNEAIFKNHPLAKKPFVILCYPQSGSRLLKDLLNQFPEIQCYGDVFKKGGIELSAPVKERLGINLKSRDSSPLGFIRALADDEPGKHTGFKIFPRHCKKTYDWASTSEEISRIALWRSPFEVYVTLERANITGPGTGRCGSNSQESPKLNFNAETFEKVFEQISNRNRKLRKLAREDPDGTRLINYDQLTDPETIRDLARFIGITEQPATTENLLYKLTAESYSELFADFDKVLAYVLEHHPELNIKPEIIGPCCVPPASPASRPPLPPASPPSRPPFRRPKLVLMDVQPIPLPETATPISKSEHRSAGQLPTKSVSSPKVNAIVIGNCQCVVFSDLANSMVPEISFRHAELHTLDMEFSSLIDKSDLVFAQPHIHEKLLEQGIRNQLIKIPRLTFSGLHFDTMPLPYKDLRIISPVSHHSAIAFAAWWHGIPCDKAKTLYVRETFDSLNVDRMFAAAKKGLADDWAACGLDLEPHFQNWLRQGEPFMLTNNHPGQRAMLDMTREVLKLAGIAMDLSAVLPVHYLDRFATMPIYPELGKMYGIAGSSTFYGNIVDGKRAVMDLDEFIDRCYDTYDQCDRNQFGSTRIDSPHYVAYFSSLARKQRPSTSGKGNPYIGIQSYQNWKKAVERTDASDVDPVVRCDFTIGPSDKVATAGSCFAQHIARSLKGAGLNYHVAEEGPEEEGYGIFSARYGNIYTTLQLEQLIDRAMGGFEPDEPFWTARNGVLIDPFRPEIKFKVGATAQDLLRDREKHLVFVRKMIVEMDYLVLTLGLTECWRSKSDGAVFPMAPGVLGGEMDWERYEFVNLDEAETSAGLISAIQKIRRVNPRVKIILTVSPVPLAATFE